MKELRGLVARADGQLRPAVVRFSAAIASVDNENRADGGDYILPGLIDLQINGRGSCNVMTATARELIELSGELAREGTTAWLPTATTSPLAQIEKVAGAVAEAMHETTSSQSAVASAVRDARSSSGSILGMHLEGPFISSVRLGAHPAHNLEPLGDALDRVISLPALRMITIAPELAGALAAITAFSARGVAVSLGHTNASLEQAEAAVSAGARMFTHTFNAMASMDHRRPSVTAAAMLPSNAFAAVIADGFHVHPAMLRLLFLARGARGICLTTDRVASDPAASKFPPSTVDGRLMGSAISMLEAMKLMVEHVGATVGEAILMGSTNPARVLGLVDRGKIEPGAIADLLVLGPRLELKAVFVGGRELA